MNHEYRKRLEYMASLEYQSREWKQNRLIACQLAGKDIYYTVRDYHQEDIDQAFEQALTVIEALSENLPQGIDKAAVWLDIYREAAVSLIMTYEVERMMFVKKLNELGVDWDGTEEEDECE